MNKFKITVEHKSGIELSKVIEGKNLAYAIIKFENTLNEKLKSHLFSKDHEYIKFEEVY